MGFCTTGDTGFRTQIRTACPLSCHPECDSDQTYGTCGCTNAEQAPCDDFYDVNANCPLHQVGRMVPEQCDGACPRFARLMDRCLTRFSCNVRVCRADPDTHVDDLCAEVFVSWYDRCAASLDTALTQGFSGELVSFYTLCAGHPPNSFPGESS